MKKNRLILYLFLFILFVVAMAVYGKAGTDTYTPEMKEKYTNGMRVGIERMLKKVPLHVIEENEGLSARELDRLIEGMDRIFSNYIELKEIALEYELYDVTATKTEEILEHVAVSFYNKEDKRVSQSQMESYQQLYTYLYDIHQLDMGSMEIGKLLQEIEKVSVEYEKLANESF
ncbi:hypothetical protein [Bacillus sp. FJAT-50079]|uniref:hypothetical protein n=1 Tax=Bacillus sp. FJAT-50079 TaxID=2833577 RepID=UPI001BC91FE0|nr:hypothetical protein [Bacillus sp. FJAT-50079]MBS4208820.1 hypothetical protein [Bacillus sp. FJAT-50079]